MKLVDPAPVADALIVFDIRPSASSALVPPSVKPPTVAIPDRREPAREVAVRALAAGAAHSLAAPHAADDSGERRPHRRQAADHGQGPADRDNARAGEACRGGG